MISLLSQTGEFGPHEGIFSDVALTRWGFSNLYHFLGPFPFYVINGNLNVSINHDFAKFECYMKTAIIVSHHFILHHFTQHQNVDISINDRYFYGC